MVQGGDGDMKGVIQTCIIIMVSYLLLRPQQGSSRNMEEERKIFELASWFQ